MSALSLYTISPAFMLPSPPHKGKNKERRKTYQDTVDRGTCEYIKEHNPLFFVNLLTSGGLNSYLADINEQAEELFFRLVKQLAEKEGVMEELKSIDQMAWIDAMNNIRAKAREIVHADIIYA